MNFDNFKNTDQGVSFGIVFMKRSIGVCFLKWEWTVTW